MPPRSLRKSICESKDAACRVAKSVGAAVEHKLASRHVEKQMNQQLDRQRFRQFAPAAYDHWVHVEMQRMTDRRVQLYLFFGRPKHNSWSGAFVVFSVAYTCMMLLLVLLNTNLSPPSRVVLEVLMSVSNAACTVELLLRLVVMSVPLVHSTAAATRGAMLLTNLVDAVAVGAAWIYVAQLLSGKSPSDTLSFLISFRVTRVVIVLARLGPAKIIIRTVRESAPGLAVGFLFLAVGVYISGVLVFYVDRLDEDVVQHFPDLGNAVWFMAVTFSTVG